MFEEMVLHVCVAKLLSDVCQRSTEFRIAVEDHFKRSSAEIFATICKAEKSRLIATLRNMRIVRNGKHKISTAGAGKWARDSLHNAITMFFYLFFCTLWKRSKAKLAPRKLFTLLSLTQTHTISQGMKKHFGTQDLCRGLFFP